MFVLGAAEHLKKYVMHWLQVGASWPKKPAQPFGNVPTSEKPNGICFKGEMII